MNENTEVRPAEAAPYPGCCAVCGGPIYVGDPIVRYWDRTVRVAAHPKCFDSREIK